MTKAGVLSFKNYWCRMRGNSARLQENLMRKIRLFLICLLFCTFAVLISRNFPTAVHAAQDRGGVRTPTTESGQPGTWVQPAGKRTVDVRQLKSEARELTAMSQLLPDQMEQIGNGKLPKGLIENLKKIEKLAKRIRSEVE
jgi:hypothetical protein